MTMGTWLFWSILCWFFFNLIWLKFVEKFVPQWIGAIIATLIALALFKYGPRPKEEEEEEEE
jgi:glycerol uptake facilitator-like aquaporin